MKVTELLRELNKSDKFDDANYSFEIFSDNSGQIVDSRGEIVINFTNYHEMQEELNELYDQLKENIKIKFEL